ncbi:PAAR domain-containing protein [Burkholderia territorii]|uniref:PAAR domain-containing protein n=1 Tax=Burkholderia territorii TaxID=1503055 RepID=UPI0009BFC66B|nr:PAAR domain-containing protein [Burkholderia territorii]
MLGIVRVGDKNESGGEVQDGSKVRVLQGRGIARKGDRVTCPKHGDNYIEDGDASKLVDGIPVALHNMRCQCGCRLISSLQNAGRRS